MANKSYDASGDASRYCLQISGLVPHPRAASEPEAWHMLAAQVQAHPVAQILNPAPTIKVEYHQLPGFDFCSPTTVSAEHHQRLTTMGIQPPLAPAPVQAYSFRDATLLQGASADASSWINGMLAGTGSVRPLQRPCLYYNFMNNGDEERAALARPVEVGSAVGGAVAGLEVSPIEEDPVFVPVVRGQLDCTKCRIVREVLHESESQKTFFTVHGTDHGQFQHAIVDILRTGARGQTQMVESLCLDLRRRTHEWVHDFIAGSVEAMKNDNSGMLKDLCSSCYAEGSKNIRVQPRNTDPQMKHDMLARTLVAPAENGAAPDTSHPVVPSQVKTNARDMFEAFDWSGFHPEILESSQVGEYDGKPITNARMYPSRRDKLGKGKQPGLANASTNDASKTFKNKKAQPLATINKKGRQQSKKGNGGAGPSRR